jgi:RimJ/RimL family protein N-acetyltransferase
VKNRDTAVIVLEPLAARHLARTREWTNDPALARLLGRPRTVDEGEHARWFASLERRTDAMFFAIETAADGRHIGNVWLANIDARHKKAEVRIVIGDPGAVGRGLGPAAIDRAARHAFDVIGLHRVYAYVMDFNPRARQAFEKAGFALEGTLRDDRWIGDGFSDVFVLGRLA